MKERDIYMCAERIQAYIGAERIQADWNPKKHKWFFSHNNEIFFTTSEKKGFEILRFLKNLLEIVGNESMKGDNMFWMQFRIWFKREGLRGKYSSFTVKQLFRIFKEDYLTTYIRDKNGINVYMEKITLQDVHNTLWWKIIEPLSKEGIIIKTGRKKWVFQRCVKEGGE